VSPGSTVGVGFDEGGTGLSKDALLWGGRFRSPPDPAMMNLSRAAPSYFRLYPQDLTGSRAHARELNRAGILDDGETARVLAAMDEIEAEIAAGDRPTIPADEDVHTYLERLLTAKLGPLGGKVRAGRSRNDQTANDLRLFLRARARDVMAGLLDVEAALREQAARHVDTIAPGFTHLQPAQPISFGHQLLAHAQAILRDAERIADWDRRAARSPLGAAALAGSAIALRPDLSAAEMGYDGPCENSIDAVASRDHVAEFLFAVAMLGVNLSRLAEEIVIWTSRQFGWVVLDDSFATGSSIMPQKKNPDIAELTRGMAGRYIGSLAGLLATMKAMPLAYNRDLFEDKRAAFESVDGILLCLPAFAGMVRTMKVQADTLRQQASLGFTLATEAADWLARRGVPFAEAHEISGALVQLCEDKGCDLPDLTPDDLARVDARLTPDVLDCLSLEAAIAARSGYGGTAPARVREQIGRLDEALARHRAWREQ
jgi:argininosuccinate lyase